MRFCATCRRTLVLALCALLPLVGCGGGDKPAVPDERGQVTPGTGPVETVAQAADRALVQRLGYPAELAVRAGELEAGSRALDGEHGALIEGGDENGPFADVYLVPPLIHRRGTVIESAEETGISLTLDRPHIVFWLDHSPLANYGHYCEVVAVRLTDGRITTLRMGADPRIDGARPLEFDSDKAAWRLYRHRFVAETFRDWDENGPTPPAGRGRGHSGDIEEGRTVRCVFVGCNTEKFTVPNAESALGFFRNGIGVAETDVRLILDQQFVRLGVARFTNELLANTADLDDCDMLVLVLSGHGHRGYAAIGGEVLDYDVLARILELQPAGRVIVMFGQCHSGTAPTFFTLEVDGGRKRYVLKTSTSSANPSWNMSRGNASLVLLYDRVAARLAEDRSDGVLRLSEIEQAFIDIHLGADEINRLWLEDFRSRRTLIDRLGDATFGRIFGTIEDDFLVDDGENSDDVFRPTGQPITRVFDQRPPQDDCDLPDDGGGGEDDGITDEVEPNDDCDTATPMGDNLKAAGVSAPPGDQDHFSKVLEPGAYAVVIDPAFGIFVSVPGGGTLTGFGSLTFTVPATAEVCIGVFSAAPELPYILEIVPF